MSRNFKAYKKRIKGPRPGRAYFKRRGIGGIRNSPKGFHNMSKPMMEQAVEQREGSIYGDGFSIIG